MGTIYIDLSKRRLSLESRNQIIGTYPVAVGKPSTPTPTGDFQVLNKIKYPGGVLGTRWIQFTWQEHGIHGTNQPNLIGQAVSHGCVRMYNSDVEVVYSHIDVGNPVIIRNSIQNSSSNNQDNNRNNNETNNRNSNNQSNFVYTVKKGDSLWKISQRYNISISRIKEINNLTGNIIYPGQKLKIPA